MFDNDLTPRERRHERTKDAILNVARDMINKGGIEALSMRKIAQKIDYSPAGLYEYFGSKEEIVHALCDDADQRLGAYLTSVDSSLPYEQRVIELGLAYIRFAMQNREAFLLLFTNAPSQGSDVAQGANEPGSSFMVLYRLIQEGIETGRIFTGPLDAFAVSYAAWTIVHGMAMLQITSLQNANFDFERVNRWTLQQFIEGLKTP